MLKVYIDKIQLHRNETTLRPILQCQDLFRDVGIEFVFEGTKFDMVWMAQASFMDKTVSLEQSVSKGLFHVEQFINHDVILFDGQDSATLKGSIEILNGSHAKLLLKNTLYSDLTMYNEPSITGRHYWGIGFNNHDYGIPTDSRMDDVKLSGMNWLSGVPFNNFEYKHAEKDIDVFAMFQYPAKQNYEWRIETGQYYTRHRKACIDQLKKLPPHIKVVTAEQGKVPLEEYYNLMSRSKIIVAPFGYGEIAPRDLESCMVGSILIKPDMRHIQTLPNIYNDPKNFISCRSNYSNLALLIEDILNDYDVEQDYYVENFRAAYRTEYATERLVTHIYEIIKSLDGYGI